ncbi:maleylacetoacetate isomerase [Pararhizobium qamdonense]|uniref:maleylacetoacetate isomerase n=1 Tax=Pararhizobium qamdonense TaxID=3031126 RepID=UPI0023E0988E|nr:maleylacetoacetate isomerase [Pararhizobium qamdonense]
MKLYLNEISSAASRVRIAIALKRLEVVSQSVGILGADAESRQDEFRKVNPQGLVPALELDSGVLITQSLAIIEYLDEIQPEPPLLPGGAIERAVARSIAMAIASEIHALLPPRVALQLAAAFGANSETTTDWNRHWVSQGFDAVEKLLVANRCGTFSVGDLLSVADIFLFPQAVGVKRLGFDLSRWPNIEDVFSKLEAIPEFAGNAPAPRK